MDADRFTSVRLQQGVYGQRQEGVNMLRIKIPGGRLNADQLDAIADVTETYSQRGYRQLTTRQSIQMHFIPLAKCRSAMRRLAQVRIDHARGVRQHGAQHVGVRAGRRVPARACGYLAHI